MTTAIENTATENNAAANAGITQRSHPLAIAAKLVCHPGTMIPVTETIDIGLSDIKIDLTEAGTSARRHVRSLSIAGRPMEYSDRFGNSLSGLIGQSRSIFRLFEPDEVIERAIDRGIRADCRVTITTLRNGQQQVLAATSPHAVSVPIDDYMNIITDSGTDIQKVEYANGELQSPHVPSLAVGSQLAVGDHMDNRFTLVTPLDGYGSISSYLSMIRRVCSNGLIAMAPAFRTSIKLGDATKDGFNPGVVLRRFLSGFNHEEGYAALTERINKATVTAASVDEYFGLRTRLHGFIDPDKPGTRGMSEYEVRVALDKRAGDIEGVYGSTNLDQIPASLRKSIPTKMSVYDLINFATEVSTHYADAFASRSIAAYIGAMLAVTSASGGYDLEHILRPSETPEAFFLRHIVGARNDVITAPEGVPSHTFSAN